MPLLCRYNMVCSSLKRRNHKEGGSNKMKKIICKREYDTETATLVKKYTVG